ncbi:serine/threonine protein phosphatase 1 [Thiothrix caldifontis]|uniref:Serine/threonine protein phosphatase 1 n=1 Tax=Thiothrix caldifontis TaxID=525918 RepID=A0A1H4CP81_9GAMM|nr:metallophosphoesterase [Thiothrix caldifontis]SEA62149.1 serine/threonine protein phosphatase 1 [Thiothrix caldifontis]
MSYTPFKFFGKNARGRDFVVGDIHGSFSALECLLQRINFNPEADRVFSVGDLIDRGGESHRVIEFLNHDWFHAIMGNHERMLLDSEYNAAVLENWTRYNGGAWWKRVPEHIRPRIRKVLGQLPLAFEVSTANGHIGIVHADIPTGIPWHQFVRSLESDPDMEEYALWSRNRYKHFKMLGRTVPVEGIDLVVFGHTPMSQPLHTANFYYIDTGAALLDDKALGKLTLLQIHPVMELHQLNVRTEAEVHILV